MNRIIYSLLIIFFISMFKGSAQDSIQTSRDVQLQQLLGMSKTQYKSYSEGLKKYDKSLAEILNNKSMDKNTRGAAMEKVLGERRAFQQQYLSEVQQKKLFEFNRQHAPASTRSKQRKELEERLTKRGIRISSDSTYRH
jgi:hypothetical protein